MTLIIANQEIEFETVTWSGTDVQVSRELSMTIPCNPYDKGFTNADVKLGDIVKFYDDTKLLFLGVVTSRERSGEIGTATYTARDFLHYLLRSTLSKKYKNKTPEQITKKACAEVGIEVTDLPKTKYQIKKILADDTAIYDLIVGAYNRASAFTGQKYMPIMVANKLSVIVKGTTSNVRIAEGYDITSAEYSDTTDDVVNQIAIYDDKGKKLGQVKNAKSIGSYGIYQNTYKKEKGVNAKKVAKSMLTDINREISIESANGDTRALSGYSLELLDTATNTTGIFYITSDTHTFENGNHTMELELAYRNTSEDVNIEYESNNKKELKNSAKCFYLDGSTVYHSSKDCPTCKGKKKFNKSTVKKMKAIKLQSGANKGKRKYKPCAKCWEE